MIPTKLPESLEEPSQVVSSPREPFPRRLLRSALPIGTTVAIVIFMTVAGMKMAQVTDIQIVFSSWTMALALLLAILYRVVNACGWPLTLRAIGSRVDCGKAVEAWLFAESSRWLPGSIWGYVSRATMASRIGVSMPIALASMLIELIIVILAAGFVAIPGLVYCMDRIQLPSTSWSFQNVLVVTIGMLFSGACLAFAGRRLLRGKIEDLRHRFVSLSAVRVDWTKLFAVFVFFLVMNTFNGCITLLVFNAVSFHSHVPTIAVISAVSGAWLCGFFAFFSPSGLMVREAMFAAMLLPWMPYAESLTIAVLARLLQFIAEAITTICVALKRLKEHRRESASTIDDTQSCLS